MAGSNGHVKAAPRWQRLLGVVASHAKENGCRIKLLGLFGSGKDRRYVVSILPRRVNANALKILWFYEDIGVVEIRAPGIGKVIVRCTYGEFERAVKERYGG